MEIRLTLEYISSLTEYQLVTDDLSCLENKGKTLVNPIGVDFSKNLYESYNYKMVSNSQRSGRYSFFKQIKNIIV